jgi:hypothetical protein
MRRGIGAARPDQKLFAFPASRKRLGAFAIGGSLNAKPFFEWSGLLETTSLHDALLSFRRRRERNWRSHHRQLPKGPYGDKLTLRLFRRRRTNINQAPDGAVKERVERPCFKAFSYF